MSAGRFCDAALIAVYFYEIFKTFLAQFVVSHVDRRVMRWAGFAYACACARRASLNLPGEFCCH